MIFADADANNVALKPIVVRRPVAASMIGQGISKIDELIASGQIEARKSGKNLLILVSSLEAYIANLPVATLKSSGNYVKKPAATAATAD
jgi:hypothetical protein